ncbi:MAG: four helix bundle protein [Bacteroidetes bacterium]|nr:MAG: four helix bundle protein [Bacteroidota bacterium]
MNSEVLKNRFKNYAIEVALLIRDLPRNTINIPYSNQLIRCSSSPGANYRAACRAKSMRDFINKLKIVEEELDETIYFLELLRYFNSDFRDQIDILIKEGNELLAITVASLKTSRAKQKINGKS